MILVTPQSELRRELCDVEAEMTILQQQLGRAVARREAIVTQMLDNTGAHDQRPVGLR